jgi:cell division protein FtsI/penicillin-binding protein 2
VATAIEVSCNYFFYEAAFRLGNAGGTLKGIETLNKYMSLFGLDQPSGVEIEENFKGMSSPGLRAKQPDNKTWTDSNTVRTAIGQDLNSYSPAVMAKYVAAMATRGVRYKSTLISKIETSDGEPIMKNEPVVEEIIELKDETWDSIYKGMINVTTGSRGTARATFSGFPVAVAGKTGTAEIKGRDAHTTFGGFAPYPNPEIAVFVIVPYGEYKGGLAPASEIAEKIIEIYMGLKTSPEIAKEPNALIK